MTTEPAAQGTATADGVWLHRVGGVSAVAIALLYVIIIVLFANVGAPPATGEDWLRYLPGKTVVWWAIVALSVVTDFLFIPVGLALYVALRRINRDAMLLATALVGLFVVLDLAITWPNFAALLAISDQFEARTATEAQLAAYRGAANYAAAVLASPLERVYAIVDLSSGILITGVVMLRSTFSRSTAYVGVLTGVLGLVSITGWFPAIIMNAVGATIWLFLVGFRLWRMASTQGTPSVRP